MKKFEQLKSQYHAIIRNNMVGNYDEIYVSAVTSDFDRLFELSWKTLKEYLQKNLGMTKARSGSPRDILGLAYSQQLIDNEKVWFAMLSDRNDDTHQYLKSQALLYKSRIEDIYLPEISKLIHILGNYIPEEEVMPVQIPESLIALAVKEGKPLYKLVNELTGRFQISEEELFRQWDNQYRQSYFSS